MTDYVDPIYEFDAPQYVDFDALPTRDVLDRFFDACGDSTPTMDTPPVLLEPSALHAALHSHAQSMSTQSPAWATMHAGECDDDALQSCESSEASDSDENDEIVTQPPSLPAFVTLAAAGSAGGLRFALNSWAIGEWPALEFCTPLPDSTFEPTELHAVSGSEWALHSAPLADADEQQPLADAFVCPAAPEWSSEPIETFDRAELDRMIAANKAEAAAKPLAELTGFASFAAEPPAAQPVAAAMPATPIAQLQGFDSFAQSASPAEARADQNNTGRMEAATALAELAQQGFTSFARASTLSSIGDSETVPNDVAMSPYNDSDDEHDNDTPLEGGAYESDDDDSSMGSVATEVIEFGDVADVATLDADAASLASAVCSPAAQHATGADATTAAKGSANENTFDRHCQDAEQGLEERIRELEAQIKAIRESAPAPPTPPPPTSRSAYVNVISHVKKTIDRAVPAEEDAPSIAEAAEEVLEQRATQPPVTPSAAEQQARLDELMRQHKQMSVQANTPQRHQLLRQQHQHESAMRIFGSQTATFGIKPLNLAGIGAKSATMPKSTGKPSRLMATGPLRVIGGNNKARPVAQTKSTFVTPKQKKTSIRRHQSLLQSGAQRQWRDSSADERADSDDVDAPLAAAHDDADDEPIISEQFQFPRRPHSARRRRMTPRRAFVHRTPRTRNRSRTYGHAGELDERPRARSHSRHRTPRSARSHSRHRTPRSHRDSGEDDDESGERHHRSRRQRHSYHAGVDMQLHFDAIDGESDDEALLSSRASRRDGRSAQRHHGRRHHRSASHSRHRTPRIMHHHVRPRANSMHAPASPSIVPTTLKRQRSMSQIESPSAADLSVRRRLEGAMQEVAADSDRSVPSFMRPTESTALRVVEQRREQQRKRQRSEAAPDVDSWAIKAPAAVTRTFSQLDRDAVQRHHAMQALSPPPLPSPPAVAPPTQAAPSIGREWSFSQQVRQTASALDTSVEAEKEQAPEAAPEVQPVAKRAIARSHTMSALDQRRKQQIARKQAYEAQLAERRQRIEAARAKHAEAKQGRRAAIGRSHTMAASTAPPARTALQPLHNRANVQARGAFESGKLSQRNERVLSSEEREMLEIKKARAALRSHVRTQKVSLQPKFVRVPGVGLVRNNEY